MSDGTIGYLHAKDSTEITLRPKMVKPEKPFVSCSKILVEWARRYGTESLNYLSNQLGVTEQSLKLLGCVKSPDHSVWGFPMRNGRGEIIGIRLRHENGKKWALTGSHNGLFIPSCETNREMLICEGPTDTAAALSIGIYAIGKFNCSGGKTDIIEFIKINKIKRAYIIADCDNDRIENEQVVNPGISGAVGLSAVLPILNCIVTLPCKDMRKFVNSGGNAATFKSIVGQLVWHKPK